MHGWIGTREFRAMAQQIRDRCADRQFASQLAEELARRHNELRPRPRLPTNQEFCPGAGSIQPQWIMDAIINPRPCSRDDWQVWSGDHRGRWFDSKSSFADHAIWEPPRAVVASDAIVAQVQPVYCYSERNGVRATGRRAWNATVGVEVLGWDPKGICDRADPREAVHVGFPFVPPLSADERHCIVWVLCHEAFLECVGRDSRRRTSTRVIYRDREDQPGFGQWEILSEFNVA
jgi:hypothetical protein